MNRQQPRRLSLRTRLMQWQLVVLAPLLLATLFHHLYLMPRFTKPLQDISQEITAEVLLVKNLQLTLHMSAMPVNDYLINGQRSEIDAFSRFEQRTDKQFASARSALFGEDLESQLVESAWQEWNNAKGLANQLLGITSPVGKMGVDDTMERFDRHIDDASAKLEELYGLAYEEIMGAQQQAHAAHEESQWVSIVAFLFAIMLSLFLGSTLTQSILLSLNSLHLGACQIAAGDLGQRVHAGGVLELEALADAFNNMAVKLQAHNAELKGQAVQDPLTALGNRRAFDTYLSEEVHRAMRYHHSLSLLMLDVDHFKSVNDTYGHPVGDAVLRKLAAIINHVVRPVDRVFRYGGEEFTVLMPETDADGAYSLAERIRKAVAESPFPVAPDTNIAISVSVGAATYPHGVDTKEILVANADFALYQAKQNGRNQVRMATYAPKQNATEHNTINS